MLRVAYVDSAVSFFLLPHIGEALGFGAGIGSLSAYILNIYPFSTIKLIMSAICDNKF